MKTEGPGGGRRGRLGEKPSVFSAGPAAEGEVRLWGDGRKQGGLREAGWPGPLLADGGKRHLGLSLWMLSSAAIVWQVQQQQTHAPGVSLATRNRNKLPPLLSSSSSQACTHAPHHPASKHACTSKACTKHTLTSSMWEFPCSRGTGQTERNMLPHCWPLRSTENQRSDRRWHSRGSVSYRCEDQMQCSLMQSCLKQSPVNKGDDGNYTRGPRTNQTSVAFLQIHSLFVRTFLSFLLTPTYCTDGYAMQEQKHIMFWFL